MREIMVIFTLSDGVTGKLWGKYLSTSWIKLGYCNPILSVDISKLDPMIKVTPSDGTLHSLHYLTHVIRLELAI